MKTWRAAGPSLRPGAQTPGTAASLESRSPRDPVASAATIASRRSSTSPTKKASKKAASGQGLATAGPPPRTIGSAVGTLAGVERNAGEVEHLEDVGEGQLVGQREAPEVALGHRSQRLERPQRHAGGAHLGRHVRPRTIGAFGGRRRRVVQMRVEDLQRRVGDPDLIHVRIGQYDARAGPGLQAEVELPAGVAARPLDASQEPRDLIPRPCVAVRIREVWCALVRPDDRSFSCGRPGAEPRHRSRRSSPGRAPLSQRTRRRP